MGLRWCLSHRIVVASSLLCAVVTIGCGESEPNAATTAAEKAKENESGDTQYVSSSQSSADIDFDDLSGSQAVTPPKVGNGQADSTSSAALGVLAERKHREKYDNGAKHRLYDVRLMSNNKVVKHGRYLEYYPDGTRFKEGSYTNNLQDGRWGYWHPNGKPAKYGRYKLGEHDGKWVYLTKEELKRKVEVYEDGKRNGTWLFYWRDSEQLRRSVDWKNDKRDGKSIEYFADGQRKVSAEWQNDKLHGRVLKWYPDGKKLSYEEYADGKKNGRAVMWSKSGTIQAEFRYRDDNRIAGG